MNDELRLTFVFQRVQHRCCRGRYWTWSRHYGRVPAYCAPITWYCGALRCRTVTGCCAPWRTFAVASRYEVLCSRCRAVMGRWTSYYVTKNGGEGTFLCIHHPTMSAKALCFTLSRCLVRPFVRPVRYCYLPRYLINALNNFDKTIREYSLSPTDDLIRFWRSKVKRQGHSYVEAESSTSTLGRRNASSLTCCL